jgi:hypothetical protein
MEGAFPESRMSLTLGSVQWMTVEPLVVRTGWTVLDVADSVAAGIARESIGVKSSVESE